MNNICGKEKNLKEGYVGRPVVRGNSAQRIVVKQFADVLLYGCPRPVKKIYSPGTEFEVCYKNMVDVFLVLEKLQLLHLLRALRKRTSYHHEAVLHFLLVMNLLPKFSCFPTILQGMKFAAFRPRFDIWILFCHDHITTSCTVEKTDQSAPVKTRVHSKPDAGSRNCFGRFRKAGFDKRNSARGTYSVARSQTPMPEFLEAGFEAKQGMIGTPSMFLWIVPYFGSLLFSIDYNHNRVQVEGKCGSFRKEAGKDKLSNCRAVSPAGELLLE